MSHVSRVGLGCMRLSTDEARDDARARATITSALDAGASWLDTAHSYGRDSSELGHNERLVARALAGRVSSGARVVTKCGMSRPDLGRWEPDGRASPSEATAEVVLVMGIVGAGKTRLAESYVARGYERLNRDVLGGTLRGIAQRLGQRLASGTKRLVLDNTYVTRASRSEVVRVAHAAGAIVRCVHVETPPHEAQVNCASRMLDRHGELLGGAELMKRAKSDANLFSPNTLFRMARQLERPCEDEGFASIEILPFVRTHSGSASGVLIPIELVLEERTGSSGPNEKELALRLRPGAGEALECAVASAPVLLYGWRPGIGDAWRARASELVREMGVGRRIEIGVCAHASGPPVCWCRPPLPGLWVAFARRHAVDPRLSVLVAATPADRAMARNLGLKHVAL